MARQHELRRGDPVSWNTSQGRTRGRVVRKLVTPTAIDDYQVHASRARPQFLVRSDKTGEEAAHLPSALRRLSTRTHPGAG
jgi:hypothetical protein